MSQTAGSHASPRSRCHEAPILRLGPRRANHPLQPQARRMNSARTLWNNVTHALAARVAEARSTTPRAEFGYAVAIAGTMVAAVVRWNLVQALGPELPPYITFYPVIILSAFLGGTGAGLLGTALSGVAVDLLFLSPRGSLRIERPVDAAGMSIFLLVNVMISLVGGTVRKAQRRSEQQACDLVRNVTLLDADLAAMGRLHDLTTRFLRQEDPKILLGAVLDAAIFILAASKGYVQLVDPASGKLAVIVHRGFESAFVEFFSQIGSGTAACGTAMQTRHCVIVEDITTSPLFLAEPRALELKLAAGMRAVVCAPLLTRAGSLVGVLSVHFAAPHRPSDRDLRFLDLLARQAADFLERTQAEAALRAAREALAHANDDLEHRVLERNQQLAQAVAELEGFSYSITHDMRAPLRAMQTFATMIEEECAGHPRSRTLEYTRRIKLASHRLDELIQDALNYIKIVRQQTPLSAVDVAELLQGLVDTYPSLQPPAADISILFDHLLIMGNESALTQVFSNLLNNAVKFVAPSVKPCIRVWAEIRNGELPPHEETRAARRQQFPAHEPQPARQPPHPYSLSSAGAWQTRTRTMDFRGPMLEWRVGEVRARPVRWPAFGSKTTESVSRKKRMSVSSTCSSGCTGRASIPARASASPSYARPSIAWGAERDSNPSPARAAASGSSSPRWSKAPASLQPGRPHDREVHPAG